MSLHQDWLDCGWASMNRNGRQISRCSRKSARRRCGFRITKTLTGFINSPTRTAIVLWTEIPLIDRITEAPAFYANAKQQLIELIRQNYNHPSVVCWGIFNEITLQKGPEVTNLVSQLAELAAAEDSTRPSTCAVAGADNQPSNWYSKVNSFNKYSGWYSKSVNDFTRGLTKAHASYPTNCIGISEYGAGASIYQHSEDPVAKPEPKANFILKNIKICFTKLIGRR
ncbi:MAG: glycoside hydrolase family 2 TIM barrel-domain containing protein [Limisphaerales bacterium]